MGCQKFYSWVLHSSRELFLLFKRGGLDVFVGAAGWGCFSFLRVFWWSFGLFWGLLFGVIFLIAVWFFSFVSVRYFLNGYHVFYLFGYAAGVFFCHFFYFGVGFV